MSLRGGTRVRATVKPVVVLAGEDSNDRRSMRIVLEAFCPEMRGRIVEINDAVRLREAGPENLTNRVDKLGRLVRARAAREGAELACVSVHEDFDKVHDTTYQVVRDRVQAALAKEFGTAHYVLAAWEMEAWLLLFPDTLTDFVKSWKVPAQLRNRDTGLVSDPKKALMQRVSSTARRYRESDAPDVLARAVVLNHIDRPDGTNRSWQQLRTDTVDCCRTHLGPRGRTRR